MKAITHPLDRGGTLYVKGAIHSTGLFHTDSFTGIYQWSAKYGPALPEGDNIVLNADEDGENFEIERIYRCPMGETHHHFETDAGHEGVERSHAVFEMTPQETLIHRVKMWADGKGYITRA